MNSDYWSYTVSVCLQYLVNDTVSTKFVVFITRFSFYSVVLNHPVTGLIIVTDLRFNFLSFPFYVWLRYLLDIQIFYSVILTHLPKLAIYHIFIWPFCILSSITITNFIFNGITNSGPVKLLKFYHVHSIYSLTKEIHVTPM